MILAVVMLTSMVSCSRKKKSKKKTDSQTMYKVEYVLPEGTSDADAAIIKLPETEMVAKGTAINTLTTPSKEGELFVGWYLDPQLETRADGTSLINGNIKLYPRFAASDGYEMEMQNNYVAVRNVDPTFTIEVITDAASDKELLKYFTVTNLSKNTPAVFIAVPDTNPVWRGGDSMSSGEVTEDNENVLWDFLVKYIGEEELEKNGIKPEDMPSATVSGFKKALGLREEDNLEEYLISGLGMDVASALELEELLGMYEETQAVSEILTNHYVISAPVGWDAPDLYQAEILDTEHVRFIYDGQATSQHVIYYNFTVKKTEIDNMKLDSGVKFVKLSDAQGVNIDTTMYKLIGDQDGNISQVNADGKGTMQYKGSETFRKGDVLAVYDGTLDESTKKVDGRVTYIKITGVSGSGKYEYVTAEVPDVVFMPDIIPVEDNGSYGTGSVTLTAAQADFSDPFYKDMGLSTETVIEKGDYLAFYRGNLKDESTLNLVGYALITSVEKDGNNYKIRYTEVTVAQMLTSADLYMVQNNVDIPMTQEEIDEIEKSMRQEAEKSGFFTETSNYLSTVITGENYTFENSENAAVMKNMTFRTDTGSSLSLGDVQLLAAGKKVEVSKPEVAFSIGGKLEYLAADSGITSGIRGELSASFEITINLNKNSAGVQNQIKISCTAVLEQEIALGVTISCEVKWGWKTIFYVIQDFEIQLALVAGTYSGLGVTVTIQTATEDEDKAWGDLINASNQSFTKAGEETGKKAAFNLKEIGEKCSAIKDKLDKFGGSGMSVDKDKKKESGAREASQSVGGSFQEKYSGMLDNDCDWCYLIDKELTRLAFRPDPFQLVEVSLSISFIVKFKLNCMIGFGVSYENVKQLSFTIYVNEGRTESSNADLKTPAFRADFYVFGMAGLRIGFKFDARVGLLSTKLDSVGVVAELGVFFEVYGFLYIHYSWVSGEGESKGIMGSLYFRIGLFLDISFLAQLGDGKLSYSKDLFKIEWPFFEAGAKEFPLGFAESDTLNLTIPKGDNKVIIPTDFFEIEMMTLTDGDTDNENCDSEEIGSKGDTWTVDGITYTQYNEKNFIVSVSNKSFTYLPASNTVYVQNPGKSLKLEADITFTYKVQAFGFNTEPISRTVHVTWETDPSTVNIEYYTVEKDGTEQLRETKQLTAYEGIYYDYVLRNNEVYKYDNYRLYKVDFPELPARLAGVEEITKQIGEIDSKLAKSGISDAEKETLEAQKMQLTAKYTAAQIIVNSYQTNIQKVADGEEYGVITFPFTGENAKIKLYYHQPEHTVRWYIPEEIASNGSSYVIKTLGSNHGRITLAYRDRLEDVMAEISALNKEGYEMSWRIVNKKTVISRGDYLTDTQLKKVPTLMPDDDIAVVGIYQPRDYKVTYMSGDSELACHYVPYGELIADLTYRNRAISELSTENTDGTVSVTLGHVAVSASSMNSAVFSPATVPIIQRTVSSGDAASLLAAAAEAAGHSTDIKAFARFSAPDAPEKDGMELDYWLIDGREKLTRDSVMPARDIVITPVYKAKTYIVKWVSEGRTVMSQELAFGDVLVPPSVSNSEGIEAKWTVNGQEFTEGMTMPAFDITLNAFYSDHTHNWINPRTVKAATCSEVGELVFSCDGCDETKSVILDIDPSNHVHRKTVGQKAATASEDGYTGDIYCDDCGQLLEKGTVIAHAHVHSYDGGTVTKEATCKEEGKIVYTCSCGDTKTENIPADPSNHVHTEVRNSKAATLSETGYSGDVYCADCGEKITSGEVAYAPHSVTVGIFSLSFLNDPDYDYYDSTLGYFNSWCNRTCTINFVNPPEPSSPDEPILEIEPINEILVLSGDTVVLGSYEFEEQDLRVADMTQRDYWAVFTPDPEFAGVGSFRFKVTFVD